MATSRSGSCTAHSNVAASEQEQLVEDFDMRTRDNEPEKLIKCPYDKSHQIRVSRLPYHLLKCRKNHPELVKELQICPYNARHLISRKELAHHTATCEDRVTVSQTDPERNGRWHVPVSTWRNPDMTEDWDEEADENPIPFVWGTSTSSEMKMGPNNNLGCHVRAPDILPWQKKSEV